MTLHKYVGGRRDGDVEEDSNLVSGQRFKDLGAPEDEVGMGVYEVSSETEQTESGLARLIRFTPKQSTALPTEDAEAPQPDLGE